MIHMCRSSIVSEILSGICVENSLFHLGCLWTLVLIGVGGGVAMYEGFICILLVLCSNFDLRFGMFNVVFL
jgi:hypothetical protein